MSKRAIVSGVLGQDGSYLAEYLISIGYSVYGIYRRISSGNNFNNINSIKNHKRFRLIDGDITDYGFISSLIKEVQPDEYYGLAAQSHVGYSFSNPMETHSVNATAVLGQLEAIRHFSPATRFYNAATSEIYGGLNCPETGFNEASVLNGRSPYGVSKIAALNYVKNYREAYSLFACSGILFNHSSVRRGVDFATRKITQGVASIVTGRATTLKMGNMLAERDEGCSIDFVKAMHLMLQQDTVQDYVVCTQVCASIKEMLEYVCSLAGLKYDDVYEMDERFMRPSEVPRLLGDASKIKALGWEPEYNWKSLLKEMYEHDLALLQKSA